MIDRGCVEGMAETVSAGHLASNTITGTSQGCHQERVEVAQQTV